MERWPWILSFRIKQNSNRAKVVGVVSVLAKGKKTVPIRTNCFNGFSFAMGNQHSLCAMLITINATIVGFHSRKECSKRGVIRALPPAFVGNCPRGHCEQEWYKTPPLSKSTSLKSTLYVRMILVIKYTMNNRGLLLFTVRKIFLRFVTVVIFLIINRKIKKYVV
jgi:hypothetical protein